jgi:hypothetical protein
MGVDYGVEIIYGFKLDSKKLKERIKLATAVSPDFDIHEWMEEVTENSPCEFVYENHYRNIGDSDIYFGIVYYNRITAENLAELERDRKEEICDEFIRIFLDYELLDREQIVEPELHAVAQIY